MVGSSRRPSPGAFGQRSAAGAGGGQRDAGGATVHAAVAGHPAGGILHRWEDVLPHLPIGATRTFQHPDHDDGLLRGAQAHRRSRIGRRRRREGSNQTMPGCFGRCSAVLERVDPGRLRRNPGTVRRSPRGSVGRWRDWRGSHGRPSTARRDRSRRAAPSRRSCGWKLEPRHQDRRSNSMPPGSR